MFLRCLFALVAIVLAMVSVPTSANAEETNECYNSGMKPEPCPVPLVIHSVVSWCVMDVTKDQYEKLDGHSKVPVRWENPLYQRNVFPGEPGYDRCFEAVKSHYQGSRVPCGGSETYVATIGLDNEVSAQTWSRTGNPYSDKGCSCKENRCVIKFRHFAPSSAPKAGQPE